MWAAGAWTPGSPLETSSGAAPASAPRAVQAAAVWKWTPPHRQPHLQRRSRHHRRPPHRHLRPLALPPAPHRERRPRRPQISTLQPTPRRPRLALHCLVRRGKWRVRAVVDSRDHRRDANDVSQREARIALVRTRGPSAVRLCHVAAEPGLHLVVARNPQTVQPGVLPLGHAHRRLEIDEALTRHPVEQRPRRIRLVNKHRRTRVPPRHAAGPGERTT